MHQIPTAHRRRQPLSVPALAILGILMIVLLGGAPALALDVQDEEPSIEDEGVPVGKGTVSCDSNSSRSWCSGSYADLVRWIRVDASGRAYVRVRSPLVDEANQNGTCSIVNYVRVWPNGDGGEENQLNVLYISSMTNGEISITLAADSSGACYMSSLSGLYP